MNNMVDKRIHRFFARFRWPFRGVLTSLNTATNFPMAQVSGASGELLQAMQLFQQHGFASAPPLGSQGIVIPLGGKTDQAVFIACQNGSLTVKNLQPGEAVLYGLDGDKVYMTTTGIKLISTRNVILDAPDLIVNGISVVNHKHDQVQPGTGISGKPKP